MKHGKQDKRIAWADALDAVVTACIGHARCDPADAVAALEGAAKALEMARGMRAAEAEPCRELRLTRLATEASDLGVKIDWEGARNEARDKRPTVEEIVEIVIRRLALRAGLPTPT